MKFFHLSDLHLGRREREFSLLDDQAYILDRIVALAREERPDGVLVAGDLYDKPVPPAEAVRLLDDFLNALADTGAKTFVVSGNHDSPERVAFGGRLMAAGGAFLSPVYNGETRPVTLTDEYGDVDVFLLPFVKPANVRRFFPDEEIATYTDALRAVVSRMPVTPGRRSVLVTHQLVTGAGRSESEEISIGGADNVDASVFDAFDYVALGHIHRAQAMGRPTLRYCGAPLKYSFGEAGQQKSLAVAELRQKGDVSVRELPLVPKRDMRELRGAYADLTARAFYAGAPTGDYLRVTLTDEEDVPYAIQKLSVIYPNIMQLTYDNARTRAGGEAAAPVDARDRSPLELFAEFYEKRNGAPMGDEQREYLREQIRRVWEGGE